MGKRTDYAILDKGRVCIFSMYSENQTCFRNGLKTVHDPAVIGHLKVICGILKAYCGKLRNVAEGLFLTQDPKNVFAEETVRENLERVYNARIVKDRHGQKNPHDKKMNTDMTPSGYIKKMEGCTSTRGRTMNEKKQEGDIEVISERLGISHILDMHPYDILEVNSSALHWVCCF